MLGANPGSRGNICEKGYPMPTKKPPKKKRAPKAPKVSVKKAPKKKRRPRPPKLQSPSAIAFQRGDENDGVAWTLEAPLVVLLGKKDHQITGGYDEQTAELVAAYKASRGIRGDGESVDNETLARIHSELQSQHTVEEAVHLVQRACS